MAGEPLLWLVVLVPALAGAAAAFMPGRRLALGAAGAGVAVTALLAARAAGKVFTAPGAPLFAADRWLFLDPLGAFHLALMAVVFLLATAYAWVYFGAEIKEGHLTLRQARVFAGLWCGALAAMALVLVSHNVGMLWVGIEATTLLTAFLICVHRSRESLEAMWKYILICSVGVAFAFMGTLLAAAAAKDAHLSSHEALLWTSLRAHAAEMDPTALKAAFIFLLVGYGVKAGLAPLHNWLPDAHSQAPAPVSAVFSGFMLNTALYCILRYVPIVDGAPGCAGWAQELLVLLGLFSVLVAGAFIVFQRDLKRLLAYSSVEHLGIIALGVGLGGAGVFAALFHAVNHSLGKTLAFCSAGRLGQIGGGHELTRLSGAMRLSRVWGVGVFAALLALIGAAPFAVFMSEFLVLKSAFDGGRPVVAGIFLFGAAVVFVGALRHAIPLAWGPLDERLQPRKAAPLELLLVAAPLLALLALGLWMPASLQGALRQAAAVVQAAPDAVARAAGGTP